MKTCSVCQLCYEDNVAGCVKNHGTLITERSGTREMIPNYRLDSLLERNVVGESYLATNLSSDQPFVVKIIDQNLIIGAGERARQTLENEAQAAADLNHLNIARIYESGWLNDGEFYIVTESVGDKTLQGLLRNTGALPESESVKIAQQTAQALVAAHAAGIIHRAVSPANIVLTRNEQNQLLVKLRNFDFGGIKQNVVAGKFAAGAKIDTLRYLSPEQFSGKSVDAQTDVYSLGIVLYEMLCGRSPFNAPTSESIADRQIDEQPLTNLRFDVRALLTHTIKESLQKRSAARLETGNFARQLQHISLLILPLGENLPAAPQVLLSNEDEFAAPVIEDQSPREAAASDRINPAAANEFSEQSSIAEAAENTSDETFSLGELAPVFIMKNAAETDLSAAEPIQDENADANINSFEPNPMLAGQTQINEILSEPDVEPNEEIASNEMPPLGELAPVFIVKSEADVDSLPTQSVAAESQNAKTNSFEPSPIAGQNQAAEIPLESAGQNQVDEAQFDAAAPTEEITLNKISPLSELAPVVFDKSQLSDVPLEPEPIIVERKTVDAAPAEPEVVIFPEENPKNTYRKIDSPSFTNYSDEAGPRRRTLPVNRSALVGAGLLGLLFAVILGAFLYNRMQHPAASEQTTAAAAPKTQTAPETANDKNDTAEIIQPDRSESKNSAPLAVERKSSTASKRPQNLPEQTAAADNETVVRNEPVQEKTAREETAATGGKPQTELNSALGEWISATNSRDVDQQMNYYAPKLNAYYLTRNTSQNAVRAEKKRVFSRADDVDIQTGKPDITLSPDGQKATMRFRKKYAIKQGEKSHRGEVLQELQWVKSDDGWRIVSERDIKVINR